MTYTEFVKALKSYGWEVSNYKNYPDERYTVLQPSNPREIACAVYSMGIVRIHSIDCGINDCHEFFCGFDDYILSDEQRAAVDIQAEENITYRCSAGELLDILSGYRNGEQLVARLEVLKVAHMIDALDNGAHS